jgi:TonB-like protein
MKDFRMNASRLLPATFLLAAACASAGPPVPPYPALTLAECAPVSVADTIYLEAEVTKAPTLLEAGQVRPPAELRADDMPGVVYLAFVVDAAGKITPGSVKVRRSSHEGLEAAARGLVTTGRYAPGELNGRPVAVCMAQSIRFGP